MTHPNPRLNLRMTGCIKNHEESATNCEDSLKVPELFTRIIISAEIGSVISIRIHFCIQVKVDFMVLMAYFMETNIVFPISDLFPLLICWNMNYEVRVQGKKMIGFTTSYLPTWMQYVLHSKMLVNFDF